jgi:formamidopyrimidine-DNA glycosylase
VPELPEVETVARQLDPEVRGRKLREVEVRDHKLEGSDWDSAAGYTVSKVRRVSKRVVFDLARAKQPPLWIAVHLRMTGRLIWTPHKPAKDYQPHSRPPTEKSLRLVFQLAGGELRFYDTRRFGTVELLDVEPQLVGPALEPLSEGFTAKTLGELLKDARGEIKPWLMRQDRIAGMGNIYASEALFRAGIHPRRAAGSLSTAEVRLLRKSINNLLCQAIGKMGTTFSDYADAKGESGSFQKFLRVYGRKGQPCRKCGTPIEQITQQQRSTFFCPVCANSRALATSL